MFRVFLTIVQVFSCFAIIALVLLQRGKGAEAGAGFGAGASGTVFGARGAGTALSRATAIFVAIFMLNSLLLTYLAAHVSGTAAPPKSILDTAGEKTSGKLDGTQVGVKPAPAPVVAPDVAAPAPMSASSSAQAEATPPPAATAPAPTPPAAPAQPAPEAPK